VVSPEKRLEEAKDRKLFRSQKRWTLYSFPDLPNESLKQEFLPLHRRHSTGGISEKNYSTETTLMPKEQPLQEIRTTPRYFRMM
jgi:hypothetical protein